MTTLRPRDMAFVARGPGCYGKQQVIGTPGASWTSTTARKKLKTTQSEILASSSNDRVYETAKEAANVVGILVGQGEQNAGPDCKGHTFAIEILSHGSAKDSGLGLSMRRRRNHLRSAGLCYCRKLTDIVQARGKRLRPVIWQVPIAPGNVFVRKQANAKRLYERFPSARNSPFVRIFEV